MSRDEDSYKPGEILFYHESGGSKQGKSIKK